MGSFITRIRNLFERNQYSELTDYMDMYNHHIMDYDDFTDTQHDNDDVIYKDLKDFTDDENDTRSNTSPEV